MSESKTKIESLREWMVEHKLRAVGAVWLTGIVGSIAYQWSSPKKFQVKVIHSRLNAQAITLAALFGSAVVEYYDHNTGKKADKYAKYMHIENFQNKD
ncbi:PREDICTED: uncharacterized protein LOC101307509 [Fragaria vesca subsp. vesca]|uniref:uncharacterized protein LOC101307509 n=1 Tax=Fragaria vesca subsp. vesca TaxID=101020 RepID=UPI0002C2E698|nr:PREDICTED: uncharacterized protein LOC101307509 [Fragaria vesca subsp. vesca]